jgi:hypothetical protein
LGRLTIFAKGNLDVRDSLHSLRLGPTLAWNGVNEVLRAGYPTTVARVSHETWTRSDALLEVSGTIPPALAERGLALGAFPAASQFSRAVFETRADAVVLSVQPDLSITLLRHRRDGFLFFPSDWRSWRPEDRAWLRESFVTEGLLDVASSMANFARIIARIREGSGAPILVYNISSVVPGESIHAHDGMGDILSTRIRRFNLGLIELSQQTGISIIDVDAIVARAGADRLKFDHLHLTGEGCRAVAEEVVRVLNDLGCLPAAEAGA